jgi:hypothetical protein
MVPDKMVPDKRKLGQRAQDRVHAGPRHRRMRSNRSYRESAYEDAKLAASTIGKTHLCNKPHFCNPAQHAA